jgi:hypothetical protein
MNRAQSVNTALGALFALALAAPGAALAYGERDAIGDCESRIRSEYSIIDLRDATAQRLDDTVHHYKVQGLAKVDGDKYPWTCEVKNRHVTAAEYSGPRPKGMSTAQKLAVGAAAVAAAGVAANEMSKHQGSGASTAYESTATRNESAARSDDYADGLAGGPDFWEVHGVARGDRLKVRRGPSAREHVVTDLDNGAVLRNRGCEIHGGQRWCRISMRDDPSVHGWVAGRYLRESSN